jgi:hypothetical protein
MKRLIIISCILHIAFCICQAQTTHNLDIIFQRGTPDTSLYYWGSAITGVGDVNGDGYDDIAVGAFIPNTWEPKIYLFYGNSGGIDTTYDLLIQPPVTQGQNTLWIAGGDINKDGYSDVIVGTVGSRRVWIYYGGNPMDANPDIVFGGLNQPNYLGYSASIATGDLNGDDTTDLIVGDYWNTNGDGHVYIYKGSAVFDTLPWVEIKGHGGEELGLTLGSGGDVNNDGYQDLYVGAFANSVAYGWAGRLYVYHGGPVMDTIPDFIKDGEGGSQFWGESPSALCTNDKGYGRIWTGSYYYPGGWLSTKNNGKVELFYGGALMDSTPDMSIVGADTFTGLGTWFASALVDSGGLGDLICGAWEDSGRGEGRLWTGKTNQDTIVNAWITGRWERDQLGVGIANAGDVNGNGRDEIMFASNADTNRQVVICKYTGPNGVAGEPVNNEQLAINKLLQNVPNPFSQRTTIKYQTNRPGMINLSIYNVTGQLVKTLINETSPSYPSPRGEGREGSVTWDGRDNNNNTVTNGVYIYKLNAAGETMVKKMTLIR